MRADIVLVMHYIFLRVLFVVVASTTTVFLTVSSQGAAGELYESDLDTGSIAKFTAKRHAHFGNDRDLRPFRCGL